MDLLSLGLTFDVGRGYQVDAVNLPFSLGAYTEPVVSALFPTNPLIRVSMRDQMKGPFLSFSFLFFSLVRRSGKMSI